MCSSGDKTVKATEEAQAAFTKTLQGSFQTAFASNQSILNDLKTRLTANISNPQGFDPRTLTALRTMSSDRITQQTQMAQTGAGNYVASHGGSDLGSGVSAQIAGSIAGTGMAEQAREGNSIDIANGQLQNENYWKGIQGLTGVAEAENPTGYAGQATGAANSVADLSKAYLASKQADWSNAFGIVSGIAGLGTAAVGAYSSLYPGAKPTGSASS